MHEHPFLYLNLHSWGSREADKPCVCLSVFHPGCASLLGWARGSPKRLHPSQLLLRGTLREAMSFGQGCGGTLSHTGMAMVLRVQVHRGDRPLGPPRRACVRHLSVCCCCLCPCLIPCLVGDLLLACLEICQTEFCACAEVVVFFPGYSMFCGGCLSLCNFPYVALFVEKLEDKLWNAGSCFKRLYPQLELGLFVARKEEPRQPSGLIFSLLQLSEQRGMEHLMLPRCPTPWCSPGKRARWAVSRHML